MLDIIKRLEYIKEKTVDQKKFQDEEEQSADEFTQLKRSIDFDLKAVRKELAERAELMQGAEKAKKSAGIRKKLREVEKKAQELSEMQQKQAKKAKKKRKQDEELNKLVHIRENIVLLVFEHLKECRAIEKQDFLGADSYIDEGNPCACLRTLNACRGSAYRG